jgi:hypothetical protein
LVQLDHPDDAEEIYDSRGDEVSPARPLLTGDVLSGLGLPGTDCAEAMIVAHPCTMRRGADLAERVVCAPVVDFRAVRPDQWASGFFSVFPLAELEPARNAAVRLDQPVTVDAAQLQGVQRIACLDHRAILLLQQRLIFCMTRCLVTLTTIRESMSAVLVEAELQEDWCEDLCDASDDGALAAAVREFDQFLGQEGLRSDLADPNRHSQVIKRVTSEISARRSGPARSSGSS